MRCAFTTLICLIRSVCFTWSHEAQVLLQGERQVTAEECHGELLGDERDKEKERDRQGIKHLPFTTPVERKKKCTN